jgi:predicted outer membrane repeat protein
MLMFLAAMVSPAIGKIFFVDINAGGKDNGSSWVDAFKHLQDALAAAKSGDQVWVARGVYRPDRDSKNPGGSGDRTSTFRLENGVGIYGGFKSGGCAWERRDPDAYPTVLSGDLSCNDGPDFARNVENSYNVVTTVITDRTAVLDGFTIRGGNADGKSTRGAGGGMYCSKGSPTIKNCTFSGNSAGNDGGGLYCYKAKPALANCIFNRNLWLYGGGGMKISDDSSPALTDCTFSENYASAWGGGLGCSDSSVVLKNCVFAENSAVSKYYGGYGGGMSMVGYRYGGQATLTNCTFSGNSAKHFGGGMYKANCDATFTNCLFIANGASDGGGVYDCEAAKSMLKGCTFRGNMASVDGGGVFCGNLSEFKAEGCLFFDNSAGGAGAALVDPCRAGTFTKCTFVGNRSMTGAGIGPEAPQASSCTFKDNVTLGDNYTGLTTTSFEKAIVRADNDYVIQGPYEDAGSKQVVIPDAVRERLCEISIRQYCSVFYEGVPAYRESVGPVFRLSVPEPDYLHLYVCKFQASFNSRFLLIVHDSRSNRVTVEPIKVYIRWLGKHDDHPLVGFYDLDMDGRSEVVVQGNCHYGTSAGSTFYRYFHVAEDLSLGLVAVRETHVPCATGCLGSKWRSIMRDFEAIELNRIALVVNAVDTEGKLPAKEIGLVFFECEGPGEPFVARERHVLDDRGSGYIDDLFTFAEGFEAFNFKVDREEAR